MALYVSYVQAVDLVLNHADLQSTDLKPTHARIMQENASVGVSRQDLPAEVRKRLDNLLETGDPNKMQADAKAKPAPKRKKEQKQEEGEDGKATKQRRSAPDTRKRKKN